METPLTLSYSEKFKAPLQKVWEAWTNPDELAKWFNPTPMQVDIHEFNVKTGGKYRITMHTPDGNHTVYGIFKEVTPMTKLKMTWQWEMDKSTQTEIEITFIEEGNQTQMEFKHSGFLDQNDKDHHNKGWTGIWAKLHDLF